ncbi:MAG TPA: glycoside hydrolase family 16 protein [Acidimicrobiia bacterium]
MPIKTGIRRPRRGAERVRSSALRARMRDEHTTAATRDSRRARRRRRGRRVVLIVVSLVLVAAGAIAWFATRSGSRASSVAGGPELSPRAGSITSARWRTLFDDEFAGTQLGTGHWTTCYWWETTGCTNEGNHELEWYQPANVQVRDGALNLQARRQPIVGDGKHYDYTSGMAATVGRSENRFAFRYGFVETRVLVPQGTGFWPAFWMLPTSRSSTPEVDIFEMLGDQPRTVSMHVHWRGPGDNELADGVDWSGPDFTAGWHTFGLDWEPDHLTWYIDGVARWQVTDPSRIPHEPMYLIANLAVGGDNTVPPTPRTPFPSTFALDYVRVWQRG